MSPKHVSSALASEIDGLLGKERVALAEVGGRHVLFQLLDEEPFALDDFLDGNPDAVRSLEEGLRDLDSGDVISHEEVGKSLRRMDE